MPDKKKAAPISDAEEARIQAMIATNPDDWEATDADFAKRMTVEQALPSGFLKAAQRRVRGPGKKPRKEVVTLRLDPDVVAAYKAEGEGWQSRINAVLRKAKKLPAA